VKRNRLDGDREPGNAVVSPLGSLAAFFFTGELEEGLRTLVRRGLVFFVCWYRRVLKKVFGASDLLHLYLAMTVGT